MQPFLYIYIYALMASYQLLQITAAFKFIFLFSIRLKLKKIVNYLLYIKYGYFNVIMYICQTNHFKNIRLFYPSANGLLPNKSGFLLSLQQKS